MWWCSLPTIREEKTRWQSSSEVLPGLSGTSATVIVEPDRHHAIELAIAQAQPGDLVLLAGKGHEKTQTIGDRVIPFDDVAIASQVLRARERSR